MNINYLAGLIISLFLFGCQPHSEHDHNGHDHNDHSGHDHNDHSGHDHNDHSGHDHNDHSGHDHNDHSGHDHGDHSEHDHSADEEDDGMIKFSHEQMKKIDFALAIASKRRIGEIVHSSGHIQSANTATITLAAKCDGNVRIRKNTLTQGTSIKSGERLFSIDRNQLVEIKHNLERDYQKSLANLNQAKSNLERKKKLLAEKIIGQKAYDEAFAAKENAQAEFDRANVHHGNKSQQHSVSAPSAGFISELLVTEGQYVQAGQALATILKSTKTQVNIDVSPKYRSLLPRIEDATFVNPYNNKSYKLRQLGGRVISYGQTASSNGHYIPIYFEINSHPDLMPGALVEAYLKTAPNKEVLTIPKTAILEEMGSYTVFVRMADEKFEKRVIETGIDDGINIQVLSGLAVGDKVVVKGLRQVKLASMASAAPAHGHVH